MRKKSKTLKILGLIPLLAVLPATAVTLERPVGNVTEQDSYNLLSGEAPFSEADENGRYVHLVRFNDESLLDHFRSVRTEGERFNAKSEAMQMALQNLVGLQAQRVNDLSQRMGRVLTPTHSYLGTHNGIAVYLSLDEAKKLATMPGVAEVERERVYTTDTSRTPEFLGADTLWDGTNVPSGSLTLGSGITVGILDTGIVANHPSFANVAECGHGENNQPNKLISAVDCTTSSAGVCTGSSPGDTNAHGTHVAGTAAGGFVATDASPAPRAEIAGIAPCANIRSYNVCPTGSCGAAAIQAGLNNALLDGVDVINFSISGGTNPWTDNDRNKLELVDAGIAVIAAAGNTSASITNPIGTVGHIGPWVVSVANTTHDRVNSNAVSVAGGPSDLYGYAGGTTFNGDVIGEIADGAALGNELGCTANGGFPSGSMTNKIALVARGTCNFSEKITNARNAGAVGVVVMNNVAGAPPAGMAETANLIPNVMVGMEDGLAIRAYVSANPTALATVSGTTVETTSPAVGDIISSGSLRGPTRSPWIDLQKPDIAAPGTDIYAAASNGASGGPTYTTMSGTSMASPHVAGAVALVREEHPTWTPMEVASALRMTASNLGRKDGVNGTPNSGPWDADDVGSGRTDLTKALKAGLVLNEVKDNFLAANPANGGDVRTLNLPALRDLDCSPSCTFTRTVRNTLETPSSWSITSNFTSGDWTVTSTPSTFDFTGDLSETQEVTITVEANGNNRDKIHFGQLVFAEASSQSPSLHFTMAFKGSLMDPPVLAIAPSSVTAEVEEGETATRVINLQNVGANNAPLTYAVGEAPQGKSVVVTADGAGSKRMAARDITLSAHNLTGSMRNVGVSTQRWMWLTQLTPSSLDLPFDLTQVWSVLNTTNESIGMQAGDLFDIYIYSDPDRDPSNGATLIAHYPNALSAGAVLGWRGVELPQPIRVTHEMGDIIVGLSNAQARAGTNGTYSPATADANVPATNRSIAAYNFPNGTVVADYTAAATRQTMAYNWLVELAGIGGSECTSPSDVPWLSVSPASGTIAANGSANVTVTMNSTGLAAGVYTADVCIESNDAVNPISVVPVRFEVEAFDPTIPVISVAPGSLSYSGMAGTGTRHFDLTISNNSIAGVLNWNISEEVVATDRNANLVTHQLEWVPSVNNDGGSLRFLDGTTCDGCYVAPYDLNLYEANGLLDFYWINYTGPEGTAGGVAIEGTPAMYKPLNEGDVVGPSQFYTLNTSSGGTSPTTLFRDGDSGRKYLGYRFLNSTTNAVNYGYLEMTVGGTSGYPLTVHSSTYDSSGAAITIGDVDPATCDNPADVPWLSVSETSGTTAAGQSSVVGVTIDTGLLEAGTYSAKLCVESNDPDAPLVVVPVSVAVTGFVAELFSDGFEGDDPKIPEGVIDISEQVSPSLECDLELSSLPSLSLQLEPNEVVSTLGYDVWYRTNGGSWASEAVIMFGSSTEPMINLTPAVGIDGTLPTLTQFAEPPLDLTTVVPGEDLSFAVGADGVMKVWFCEAYNDGANPDGFYGPQSSLQVNHPAASARGVNARSASKVTVSRGLPVARNTKH